MGGELMIEIRLYGKLHRQSAIGEIRETGMLHLHPEAGETMRSLLGRIGIAAEDAHSIFFKRQTIGCPQQYGPLVEIPGGDRQPIELGPGRGGQFRGPCGGFRQGHGRAGSIVLAAE